MDVLAAIPADESWVLRPGERKLVPTGLSFSIPPHYEIQVRPRSGLAIREGVTALNTPGTIDSDYRGELQIILINLGQQNVVINRGMRVAQLVLAQLPKIEWEECSNLDQTARSQGGFGSTGNH